MAPNEPGTERPEHPSIDGARQRGIDVLTDAERRERDRATLSGASRSLASELLAGGY